jgi:hypothetical protein
MTISGMDQLVAALCAGERAHLTKQLIAQTVAGQWASCWKIPGNPGAATANPPTGAGEIPTRATPGALRFTNPAAGKAKYLAMLDMASTQRGTIVLYDRLAHTSGLDGTLTTVQNVNTPALTRPDALGADVEAWVEIYTLIGITARTLTVNYTNQDNAAKTATVANIGNTNFREAGRMLAVPFAAGDTGVRSVQSVQLSGTTGTAGNFGITLLRRLAFLDMPNTNTGYGKDFADLGLPQLPSDCCLALMALFDSTTSASIYGEAAYATET